MKIAELAYEDMKGLAVQLDPETDYLMLLDSHSLSKDSLGKLMEVLKHLERPNRRLALMIVPDVWRAVRFVEMPKKKDHA